MTTALKVVETVVRDVKDLPTEKLWLCWRFKFQLCSR